MASATSAQPLNVPSSSTPAKAAESVRDKAVASRVGSIAKGPSAGQVGPDEISSPHELTAFVSSGDLLNGPNLHAYLYYGILRDRLNHCSSS